MRSHVLRYLFAVATFFVAAAAWADECGFVLVATYEYDYNSDGTIDDVGYEYELQCRITVTAPPYYSGPRTGVLPPSWDPPVIVVNYVSDENPYNGMIDISYWGEVGSVGIEYPTWIANSSAPTNQLFMGNISNLGEGWTRVTVRACDYSGAYCATSNFDSRRYATHAHQTGVVAVTYYADFGFAPYPTHYTYDRRVVARWVPTEYSVPTGGLRNGNYYYTDWHDGLGFDRREDHPRIQRAEFMMAAPNHVNVFTGVAGDSACWGTVGLPNNYDSHGCGYTGNFGRAQDPHGAGVLSIDPHHTERGDTFPLYGGDFPELWVTPYQ